jgi:hypothetical protein
LVVTPPGFLPGFRPAVLLEKRASEALWSHHLLLDLELGVEDVLLAAAGAAPAVAAGAGLNERG